MFLAIQAALAAVVFGLHRPDPSSFAAATIDKHNLLDRQLLPRIVFVGGSNLAFGLDSAAVADAMPYHPVNMGFYASLGVEFMLSEVEDALAPGDVVVVSLEYQHFTGLPTADLSRVLEQRPANFRYLSIRDLASLLDEGLIYFGAIARKQLYSALDIEVIKLPSRKAYFRKGFNEFGDVVAHHGMEPADFSEHRLGLEKLTRRLLMRSVRELNTFHKRCQRRGVRVFYSYPPFAKTLFKENEQFIRQIHAVLVRELTIPAIDDPGQMCFPVKDFFDSAYHLNKKGAAERTALLISNLQKHLSAQAEQPSHARAPDHTKRQHRPIGAQTISTRVKSNIRRDLP